MYTDQKKEVALNLLRENAGHITKTCETARISRSTFYEWIKEDPEFGLMVRDVVEGIIDDVESELLKEIKAGNVTAQIFFLVNKAAHRGWRRTDNKESAGDIPIGSEDGKILTVEDSRNLKRILEIKGRTIENAETEADE